MPFNLCAKNHHLNLQRYNLNSKDGSTWAGAWGKLTRLIPYMWPAKSASLQLRYLLRDDLILTGAFVVQTLICSYFQSHLLCIADCGGESDKCMGAHLPQDYSRRPLRREHPTRGIIRFRTKILIQFPCFSEVLALGGSVSLGWVKSLARRWNRDGGAGKSQVKFQHKLRKKSLSGPSYGSACNSSPPSRSKLVCSGISTS